MARVTYLFQMLRITKVTFSDGTVGINMVTYADGIVRMAMVTYLDGMVRIVQVHINLCRMVRITLMVTYPDGGFPAETTVERLGSSLFLFSTI